MDYIYLIHWIDVNARPKLPADVADTRRSSSEQLMTNENPVKVSSIAIVTGGSRGLGRNTVVNLAKRGVHSIFTYHTNRVEADKVVAEVQAAGARALALQLDARDVRSFDAFVTQVRTALRELGADR